MKHLMLDIETMGHTSNSVITQISAVEFDINTGSIGRVFDKKIDIQSCLDVGLTCTGGTINFWLNQSKEAQNKYVGSEKVPIMTALQALDFFVQNGQYKVWGNSARFDCGILCDAYNACKLKYPFIYWNELDVRTIVWLNPQIKKDAVFEGVKHHGIDDCKHQIKYLVKTLQNILQK